MLAASAGGWRGWHALRHVVCLPMRLPAADGPDGWLLVRGTAGCWRAGWRCGRMQRRCLSVWSPRLMGLPPRGPWPCLPAAPTSSSPGCSLGAPGWYRHVNLRVQTSEESGEALEQRACRCRCGKASAGRECRQRSLGCCSMRRPARRQVLTLPVRALPPRRPERRAGPMRGARNGAGHVWPHW